MLEEEWFNALIPVGHESIIELHDYENGSESQSTNTTIRRSQQEEDLYY